MLINITGGSDLALHEVDEAATLIQEEADEEANIIFGAVVDEKIEDEIRITVIATGFPEEIVEQQLRPSAHPAPRRESQRPSVQAPAAPVAERPRERVVAPEPRERVVPPSAESRASVLERIPRDCDNPRPVVRLGTIVDNGQEPTLTRSIEPDAPVPPRPKAEEFTFSEESDDAYEIPAFLRKSAG